MLLWKMCKHLTLQSTVSRGGGKDAVWKVFPATLMREHFLITFTFSDYLFVGTVNNGKKKP